MSKQTCGHTPVASRAKKQRKKKEETRLFRTVLPSDESLVHLMQFSAEIEVEILCPTDGEDLENHKLSPGDGNDEVTSQDNDY
ncbi:hypothetical protein VP1G_10995 [Cytospora mali]|uniref:Uncharacterized protein n=1 Tax=Cytospora mali TaxID=578113 RepID=A0A194V1V2_CYTMA|nr:hypothetical protein VP1G_10995 [Valsa mali var. pyri (nom. inval.)]